MANYRTITQTYPMSQVVRTFMRDVKLADSLTEVRRHWVLGADSTGTPTLCIMIDVIDEGANRNSVLLSTIDANVNNENLTDAEFRQFIRNSIKA